MNDFEQSLKEHADNFQMIPSKRVWHGIYNDLHPGKRWPSVTMSLLLIFTLVVIGHLNTNNSHQLAYVTRNKTSNVKILSASLKTTGGSTHNQRAIIRKNDLNKSGEVFVDSNIEPRNNSNTINQATPESSPFNNSLEKNSFADNLKPGNNSGFSFQKNLVAAPEMNINPESNIAGNVSYEETLLRNNILLNRMPEEENGMPEEKVTNLGKNLQPVAGKAFTEKSNPINSGEPSVNESAKKADKKLNVEKRPVKSRRKRNDKINWVYYAAPVVSSVSFSGEPLKEALPNFATGPVISSKPSKILHSSALGFEGGAQMNYALTKRLKFTTGVHLTYSGYNIISNEIHPFRATLILKDAGTGTIYSRNFITHFGDGTGQSVTMIRNYNWQASIPIGLQYEVTGNDKLQFNLGGNLEPSVILKSKAYVLSSDGNNYVNDPALLRKFNLSSNFGAFITFSSSKFKWEIGPNIRYQWLSTYIRDYTVKEHLIDYGIRIGISR